MSQPVMNPIPADQLPPLEDELGQPASSQGFLPPGQPGADARPYFWLTLFHSLSFAVLLVAALALFWQNQHTSYLYLAATYGATFLGHWLGWLVGSRLRRPSQGLMITAVFTAISILLPIFFFADYWVVGLVLAVLLVSEVGLAGQARYIPAFTLFALLLLAAMLASDLWLASADRLYLLSELTTPAHRSIAILALASWLLFILLPILINWRIGQTVRLNLSTQLSTLFTAIAGISIVAVMAVILWQVSTSQIQQVGQSFQTVAEFNAERIGNNLEQQITLLKSLWYDQSLLYGINTANVRYGFAAYRPETLDQLRLDDLAWQTALESSDLVHTYTLNQQAQVLAGFVGGNPNHSDLIVTDMLGGLVAGASRKPPHFFYGDEEWWQVAWNNGEGGVYIGQPQFDPQTGSATVLIAVVIKDPSTRGPAQDPEAGTSVGVLASIYNISLIQADFATLATSSGGPVELVTADGILMACSLSLAPAGPSAATRPACPPSSPILRSTPPPGVIPMCCTPSAGKSSPTTPAATPLPRSPAP